MTAVFISSHSCAKVERLHPQPKADAGVGRSEFRFWPRADFRSILVEGRNRCTAVIDKAPANVGKGSIAVVWLSPLNVVNQHEAVVRTSAVAYC
ncbi:MAG: hypothetical protein ACN6OP_12685 [Pseudomonadales bacterium]